MLVHLNHSTNIPHANTIYQWAQYSVFFLVPFALSVCVSNCHQKPQYTTGFTIIKALSGELKSAHKHKKFRIKETVGLIMCWCASLVARTTGLWASLGLTHLAHFMQAFISWRDSAFDRAYNICCCCCRCRFICFVAVSFPMMLKDMQSTQIHTNVYSTANKFEQTNCINVLCDMLYEYYRQF